MFSGQPEFSANFLYKLMKGSEEHALTDEQVAAVEADPGARHSSSQARAAARPS